MRFPIPFLFGLLVLGSPLAAQSPWEILDDLRTNLQEAGPVTGTFSQTYIPAGFSQGDQESGHLSIWLPDCLRWNYEQPEKKSFLICQGQVWFWNDGETSGRKMSVDAESEPGLDLLLLPADRLRSRYVATADPFEGGWEVTLTTPEGTESPTTARLRVDGQRKILSFLEYTDGEGNRTRFDVGGLQPLRHTALFQAPPGLEWIEE